MSKAQEIPTLSSKTNPLTCGINAVQNNTVQLTNSRWACFSGIRNKARNVKYAGISKLMIKNNFFKLWNPCTPTLVIKNKPSKLQNPCSQKTTLSNRQTWDGQAMRFERISGTWLEITNVQEIPNLSSKQILQTVESMKSKTTLSNRQTWDGHAKVISGTRLEIPNSKLMIFELSYPCSPKQHYQINKHGMEMLL